MTENFQIELTKEFSKRVKKYLSGNQNLELKITKALTMMMKDPFYKSLYTHKVESRKYGLAYSSRVTGDYRLIWDFEKKKKKIIIYSICTHEGKRKVYK